MQKFNLISWLQAKDVVILPFDEIIIRAQQNKGITSMRKFLPAILFASSALLFIGCSLSKPQDNKESEPENEQPFMVEEELEYTELAKVALPCSKEMLYNAWKQIGVIEGARKRILDYKQHTPTLFLSTDLDKDGNPEVLLRGEPPYAAIFSFVKDSLHLITCVNRTEVGLGITPDGAIVRNSSDHGGASVSEFIQLKESHVVATGATHETFVIKDNALVSNGKKYMLQGDSAMVEVSKDEYLQLAPQQEGTYLEDIDGWEDFRKP